MGIYKIVISPRGVASQNVLASLPDAIREFRTDPIWDISRARADATLQRFAQAALADESGNRAKSLLAVLEAQLEAGLTDSALETLTSGGTAFHSSILSVCLLLGQAGLVNEAFAFARDHAQSLESGIEAALALMALWPEDSTAILEKIRQTSADLGIHQSG